MSVCYDETSGNRVTGAGWTGPVPGKSPALCDPKTLPQVSQQLDEQDKVLTGLSERVDFLHQRLQPLLRIAPCAPVFSPDESYLVPLAERLRGHTARVNGAFVQIDDLLQRMEL